MRNSNLPAHESPDGRTNQLMLELHLNRKTVPPSAKES